MTYILGISALYHDSAAALIGDGKIIAAAQEERFTRIKQDNSIPVHAIDYCLREGGNLSGADLEAVVYYDDPALTLERFTANLAAAGAGADGGKDTEDLERMGSAALFGTKMWVEKILRDHLKVLGREDKLYVTVHHIAHAASAFYPSPFESAAFVTMDGVGEWNTTTIGVGNGSDIELLKKIDYPHSLGLLYSAFTYYCGFKVNFGDYKLMGLAPYGEPVYADLIKRELIDIKKDGSFRLNLDYFDYQYGRAMTNDAFAKLFGEPARKPESRITKREADIAASAQAVTEEVIIRTARTAREMTGEKNLVMAGGVSLNCTANGKLAREEIFDRIWIQPAAGDAGGALGAALAFYHLHAGKPRTVTVPDQQQGSFLGPSYGVSEIREYLDAKHAPYHETACRTDLFEKIAGYLDDQKVIGIFQGRMEYGPRALGGRSIIADPRSEKMQSHLNRSIKFRESFRPFAPAVLAERAADYFDIGGASPYMLFCADVKGREDTSFSVREQMDADADLTRIVTRRRSEIPAVTHVDYSARIQTVDAQDNPYFHGLISAFEKRTGCAVVINTSFNVRGEPIVCTPDDAYRCFMNTEMDVLVLEDLILFKEEQPESERRSDLYELD